MKKNKITKSIHRKGLLHHNYRFGFLRNIKVWFCRTFGHRLSNNIEHKSCERCGMFYGEIYHKHENWQEHI